MSYRSDEYIQDLIASLLVAGSGISLAYADGTPSLTISAAPSGIDHGGLAGLGDDDHPHYLLASGSRALAGPWDVGSQAISGISTLSTNAASIATDLTVVGNILVNGTVDGVDVASLSSAYTTHAADSTLHFTVASIDHGSIAGLGDDDHTQYYNASRLSIWWSFLTTTNLPEGTNLYYTDERVDDRVAALLQNASGLTWSYNDVANTLTPAIDHGGLGNLTVGDPHTQYYNADRLSAWWSGILAAPVTFGAAVTVNGTLLAPTLQSDFTGVSMGNYAFVDGTLETSDNAAFGGALISGKRLTVYTVTGNFTVDAASGLLTAPAGINAVGNVTAATFYSETGTSTLDVLECNSITVAGTVDGVDVSALSSAYTAHAANAGIHYTDEQVDDRVNTLLVAGTGIAKAYNDAANTLTLSVDTVDLNHADLGDVSGTTYDHVAIDDHINDATMHFTVASIDHGLIAGLGDDDHTQYLLANSARAWTGTMSGVNLSLSGTLGIGGSVDAGHVAQVHGSLKIVDTSVAQFYAQTTYDGFAQATFYNLSATGATMAVNVRQNASSSGDAMCRWSVGGVQWYAMGIDNTDDALCIAVGGVLNTSSALRLSTAGRLTFNGSSSSGYFDEVSGCWVAPNIAGDPASPINGAVWYNTSTGKLRCREGGTSKDLI